MVAGISLAGSKMRSINTHSGTQGYYSVCDERVLSVHKSPPQKCHRDSIHRAVIQPSVWHVISSSTSARVTAALQEVECQPDGGAATLTPRLFHTAWIHFCLSAGHSRSNVTMGYGDAAQRAHLHDNNTV